MKKVMLGFLVVFMLLFTGCSEDDDDNTTIDPEIIYAYALDQFVPFEALTDLIDHDPEDSLEVRNLFHFWATATDFSPRVQGYDDLDWNNWMQGYYIPELDNRLMFLQFNEQNIGAYNVKYMDMVYVFRGVNAIVNDTLSVLYELNGMTKQMVENYDGEMEDAIPLASFVPPQVAQMDSVTFTAADGWSKVYYPEEIEAGYWLVETQKTIFPGLDLPNSKKKFKWLMSMEFYGVMQEVEDFVNEGLAGEAVADWSFSFPADLTEYLGIVWE